MMANGISAHLILVCPKADRSVHGTLARWGLTEGAPGRKTGSEASF